MTEIVSSKDVALFIQLTKEKAEYSFMQKVMSSNGSKQEAIDSVQRSLRDTSTKLDSIKSKLEKAGLSVVVPNEAKIKELTEKINEENHDSFVMAIKTKTGPLYELIANRASFTKKNFESREEIGKINIFLHKLDADTKKSVRQAVVSGSLDGSEFSSLKDEKTKLKLCKVLRRLGISGVAEETSKSIGEEVEVNLGGSKVWISQNLVDDVKKNFDSLQVLNAKIQIKNAERQIRNFNDEEEKEFAKIQSEYLVLLKNQDTLLKEYNEECLDNIIITS